jgi:phosphinothricin acetyltransferase
MAVVIRLVEETDAERMLAIYAPIVRDTAISFELEPPTEEEFRQRIRDSKEFAPWLVCEMEGAILGYAYAGRIRPRAAYQWSVEVTVYVNPDYHRRGVGGAVYTSLFECLRLLGFCGAIAVITLPNPASVALHESLGFEPIGVFNSIGYKLGEWHDSGWWQLGLQEHSPSPAPPRRLSEALNSPEWQNALDKGLALLRE